MQASLSRRHVPSDTPLAAASLACGGFFMPGPQHPWPRSPHPEPAGSRHGGSCNRAPGSAPDSRRNGGKGGAAPSPNMAANSVAGGLKPRPGCAPARRPRQSAAEAWPKGTGTHLLRELGNPATDPAPHPRSAMSHKAASGAAAPVPGGLQAAPDAGWRPQAPGCARNRG